MSQIFGRYVLGQRLGAGGMGEVRLARQTGPDGFERPCVVKRMHRTLARDEGLVKLFLDEARVTAGLTHPNIAQVYDFGKIGGAYYLAMERVTGVSLSDLFAWHVGVDRPVPPPIACDLVVQAARALDYAHAATDAAGSPLHLVHRDVSPSNILVSVEGAVKLIDFGIATSAARSGQTSVGVVRGKAAYMSPEQLRGQPLDGRSDLYSLGLVLLELLIMERPLARAADQSVPQATLPMQAWLLERRPETPAALVSVLGRALEAVPASRFQTCGAFADALEQVMSGLGWSVSDAEVSALVRQCPTDIEVSGPSTSDRSACPPDEVLERFSRGELASGDPEPLRSHLDGCATCLEFVAALAPERGPSVASVAGERVGRYVIEEVLGTGGMGIVLKGRDPQLDRYVAVKLMLWDGSAERRARFVRESQAAARVRHPNVVTVHDIGFHGDELFLAMELVEGPTLRQMLKTRPPATEVARLVRGVAEGLSAIHHANLVHRDLKPENVLIDADGRPRITDFGVARAVGSALTRTGQVLGTLGYMAPEQLVGATVGPEADQFALCVMAYESFTGQRPFSGGSRAELNAAMKAGAVAAGWSAVPRPWRAVLSRGLEFDPRDRFSSVEALVAALRNADGRGGRLKLVATAAVVLAVVVGAPLTWAFMHSVEPTVAPPRPMVVAAGAVPPVPPPQPALVETAERKGPRSGAKPRLTREPPGLIKGARTGRLSVTSVPVMEVSVDGRVVGATPVALALEEGAHRVGLRAPSEGLSREERVTIFADQPFELGWAPRRVEVEVRSTPPDVEFDISVDGRPVGETPLKSLMLWEGRRRLRVRSTSGWEHEQTIEVRPDASLRLRLRDGEGVDVVPK